MFAGLPAPVANGTNRISILLQTISGTLTFKKNNLLDWRFGLSLAWPTLPGSLVGAYIAAQLGVQGMQTAVGALMAIMFVLLVAKPNWFNGKERPFTLRKGSKTLTIVMFILGIYGGFLNAGIGLFLLAAIVSLTDVDIMRANALKIFTVMLYMPIALVTFFVHDLVNIWVGLLLSLGSVIGAWSAVHAGIKFGQGFIRWLLLVVVFVSAVKFTGLYDVVMEVTPWAMNK